MGFHQGLTGELYDRQYTNKALFRRIWEYAKPQKRKIFWLISCIIFQGLAATLPPVLLSKVLDEGIAGVPNETAYAILVAGIIILQLMDFVFYYLTRRMLVRITADINLNLSVDAFASSISQDMAFHDSLSSGRIVSRITTDTSDFAMLIRLTMDVAASTVQSIVTALILFRTDWRLALALMAFVPIVILFVSGFRKLARRRTTEGMRAMADVNATIKETISGISVAKNFRQEERIYQDFRVSNAASYRVNIKRGLVLAIVPPVMRAISGISVGLLVYFGALTVTQGLITAGAWYMVLLASDRFLMPVLSITSYWTQVQTGLSAAERIFALIDARRSVVQTGDLKPDRLTGKIDFNQVGFSYATGAKVLQDFDLSISPGENVAIVGHTGAGKSSIARLISRFYEFQQGQLLIDDIDIREFNLSALRQNMGIVTQVPFLFEGTVEENIRFAAPEISRDEILSLANQIGNGEWLETFSGGLDTQVGERGAHISMGQRQMVALMRVLAHKPAIFILDEATASIDPFTEQQIQQALELILKRSTSILIAHRLSTVKSADRIIVLDHGTIIEEGSHRGLLELGGHYAELYNTYFRHQSLQYVENAGGLYGKQF